VFSSTYGAFRTLGNACWPQIGPIKSPRERFGDRYREKIKTGIRERGSWFNAISAKRENDSRRRRLYCAVVFNARFVHVEVSAHRAEQVACSKLCIQRSKRESTLNS